MPRISKKTLSSRRNLSHWFEKSRNSKTGIREKTEGQSENQIPASSAEQATYSQEEKGSNSLEDYESLPNIQVEYTEMQSSASGSVFVDFEFEADFSQRHITNIFYIMQQTANMMHHINTCNGICGGARLLVKSCTNYGAHSRLTCQCASCLKTFIMDSLPEEKSNEVFGRKSVPFMKGSHRNFEPEAKEEKAVEKGLRINRELVLSSMSCGISQQQLSELLTSIGIHSISQTAYILHQKSLGEALQSSLLVEMLKNAEREKQIALTQNRVDAQGVPWTTVVVDGCWAHRSHGHRYSALSGAACIIGHYTGKLLYLGVRNKFCWSCERTTATNNIRDHICYLNHSGSSTSMEYCIICSGFQFYEQWGLRFREVIGDDDSNVLCKLRQSVSYGREIKKKLCANHAVRNLTSHLYDVAKNAPAFDKKSLTSSKIQAIKAHARSTIRRACDDGLNCDELQQHLLSIFEHSMGYHKNCNVHLCNEAGEIKSNLINNISPGTRYKIDHYVKQLSDKSGLLQENVTSNPAENLMSIIAKVSGGKTQNRIQSGRYQSDCMVAGLRHSQGPDWRKTSFRRIIGSSPSKKLKRHVLASNRKKKLKKDTNFQANMVRRRKKRLNRCHADDNYGPNATVADINIEDFEKKKEKLIESLKATPIQQKEIEELTKGQRTNQHWHDQRRNRLTASNFGAICKMRPTTSCKATIKNLLYPREISTKAINYGCESEKEAIRTYEEVYGEKVDTAGFVVDLEHGFLGSSPDGYVKEEGLVEIKCPYSLRSADPAKPERKLFYSVIDKKERLIKLNRTHNYYYQVQGQLQITRRKWCDFIVWSPFGMVKETIQRDDDFWKSKISILKRFFFEGLLPEIVDPRLPRQMEIRECEYVLLSRAAISDKK